MAMHMNIRYVFSLTVLAAAAALALSPGIAVAADHPSPPMGWNSYTGYSIAVTEAELRKNIDFLSENLLKYGYDTVTVDNGWFLSGQGKGITMALDEHGLPESHEHFFPHGLKYTIDYAHKKGVKFGIWLLRHRAEII
jgi:alpha-galactosidase